MDELLFLDLPRERRFPSGLMMLEYEKAVQESVYEKLRVVREGHLRIIYTHDLKVRGPLHIKLVGWCISVVHVNRVQCKIFYIMIMFTYFLFSFPDIVLGILFTASWRTFASNFPCISGNESLLCSVFCLWLRVILLGVRMFHMIHCSFFTFIPGDFYDLAVCNHAVNFWNMPGCRLISWFMPHGCVKAPMVEVLLLWWHQRIYKQIVIRKKLVVEKFYAINCQPIQFWVSFIVPLVEGPIEYSMSF